MRTAYNRPGKSCDLLPGSGAQEIQGVSGRKGAGSENRTRSRAGKEAGRTDRGAAVFPRRGLGVHKERHGRIQHGNKRKDAI